MSDKSILIEISVSDLREMIKECVTAAFREERAPITKRESLLITKAEQMAVARELYAEGKSYAYIAEYVLGDVKRKGTVFYWLNGRV